MTDKTTAFTKEGNWYKGNLHTHSLLSDGMHCAQEMAALYRNAGYQFLAMTDHNIFKSYQEQSGEGFLMLAGIELTPGYDKKDEELMSAMTAHQKGAFEYRLASPSLRKKIDDLAGAHVVAICRKQTDADWEARNDRLGSVQSMIDYAVEQDCLSIVAHPAWSKMDTQALLALHGYAALEVYNHASHPWAESAVHWDSLLNHGVRAFAMACDDTHEANGACGGYIMLKAPDLSYESVINALEVGDYYSSSGPEILEFFCDDAFASVSCSPACEIRFLTDNMFGRSYYAAEHNSLTHCTHKLFGNEGYVRIEVVDAKGHKAWTNPVFL